MWSTPEDISRGYIDPNSYTTPEIICHLEATPGAAYVSVTAGETVELQWTAWPASHHGPVIDYLANCNGECTTVDKTTLLFNKIDGVGFIDDSSEPGIWAADQLIAANNSWTVTIPSSIAPGNYVLRHEIIALHSAETADGAQNYPQCVNLQVSGTGTDSLSSGTLGTELYTPSDPGVLVNIYTSLSTYIVPGPSLISGASSVSQTAVSLNISSTSISSSTANTIGYATPTYGPQSISIPVYSAFPNPTSVFTAVATTTSPMSSSFTTLFTSSSIEDDSCTVTYVYLSTSTVVDVFPVSSSLVTPYIVSSAVPSLVSAPPSGPIISTIPVTPTGTAGLNASGTLPPTPLPTPISTHQFYDWLKVILSGPSYTGKSERPSSDRFHPRDLQVWRS